MTPDFKELLYIIVYVVSIISVFLASRFEIQSLRRDVARGMKILYKEAGALNIVDNETCKRNRDEVFSAIRRSEKALEMVYGELKTINQGLMKVEFKLDALNGKQDKQ